MSDVTGGRRLLPDTLAAQELGLQVQTLRNWRCLGLGPPYVRIGTRTIRYDMCDLEKFISGNRVDPFRRGER